MKKKKSRPDNPHGDRRRARRRALQALYQWQMTGQDAGDIYRQFLEQQDMSRVDVEYFKTLVHDVIAQHAELDKQIADVADRKLEQVDPLELSVIRLAAYELLHHMEMPFRVVLDEAVNLARDFGSDQSPVYVNGVLDRCARNWRAVEVKAG
jgi:N utilization substance protein B